MVARAEALAALRSVLIGQPFEYDTVEDVTDAGDDGFLLEVRRGQRRRTHLVVIPADEASLTTDHTNDDRLPDDAGPVEWAEWTRVWLMEEFDTGLLRWGARRRLDDGTPVIDPTIPVEASGGPWSLSTVPLERPTAAACRELRRWRSRWRPGAHVVVMGEVDEEPDPHPGTHLEHAGLDPTVGRWAHHDGRLVAWFHVFDDDTAGASVIGQVVAAWADADGVTASIDHLSVLDGTPPAAFRGLVEAAVHACADEGARRVVTTVLVDGLDEVGFGPADEQGRRWLDTSTLP